ASVSAFHASCTTPTRSGSRSGACTRAGEGSGSAMRTSTRKRYCPPVPLPQELVELAARVSNWGRWGTDDQRGTLNLIDEDAVRRGVAAAREGRAFSLAIPFDGTGPQWDNVNMPHRTNPELRTHTVNMSFTGDSRDFTTSDDSFDMGSQAATHWDALSHVG